MWEKEKSIFASENWVIVFLCVCRRSWKRTILSYYAVVSQEVPESEKKSRGTNWARNKRAQNRHWNVRGLMLSSGSLSYPPKHLCLTTALGCHPFRKLSRAPLSTFLLRLLYVGVMDWFLMWLTCPLDHIVSWLSWISGYGHLPP